MWREDVRRGAKASYRSKLCAEQYWDAARFWSGEDDYTAWNTYDLRYTYDQVGNRLAKEDVYGHKDVTYTYDVENPELYGSCSNRLMTYFIDDQYDEEDEQVWYTYDDNGNVTRIVRQYADDDQYRSTWLVYGRGGQVRYVIGETWNSDDLDWQAGGEEGSEYALSNDAYTQSGARDYAQSRGGDLAECDQELNYDWVHDTFDPGTEDLTRYWVGGAQSSSGEEPAGPSDSETHRRAPSAFALRTRAGLPCGGQRARGHDVQPEIGDPESLGLGL